MKIKIRVDDPQTRATWETILEAKAEVESWPAWKRGEYLPQPDRESGPAAAPAPDGTSKP